MRPRLRFPLAVLAAGLIAAAPRADSGGGTRPRGADAARVYAAASLTDVVGGLAMRFESTRGIRVVASYGASSTLAQQIRLGAAPGVFVSASVEWADRLEAWGLVEPGSRVDLAGNSLVVIVPGDARDRPAALEDLKDARYDRIALADPVAVPAGRYAVAALRSAGVLEAVEPRIVAAQDVRTALSYVARGEAPAGIVYATDAAASRDVVVAVRIPPARHPRIVYPMVLVKGAGPGARELYAFLRSPEAWAAFAEAGFVKP